MRTNVPSEGNERAQAVGRGIVTIVVAGVFLGLAFNQLGRSSHPARGLPWIAEEKKLDSLESLAAAPKTATPTPAPAPATDLNDPLGGALATGGEGVPDVPDLDRPLQVDADTVKKFFDAKAAMIIDARGADEFAEGHIPGAL